MKEDRPQTPPFDPAVSENRDDGAQLKPDDENQSNPKKLLEEVGIDPHEALYVLVRTIPLRDRIRDAL